MPALTIGSAQLFRAANRAQTLSRTVGMFWLQKRAVTALGLVFTAMLAAGIAAARPAVADPAIVGRGTRPG